jgi:hypothetical protein
MSAELNTLRVSAGRLEAESKDVQILVDSYKERISELQMDIEDHKTQIQELKHAQAREKEEEKEKRKQEMLNDMMSRIDMVTFRSHVNQTKLMNRAVKLLILPVGSSTSYSTRSRDLWTVRLPTCPLRPKILSGYICPIIRMRSGYCRIE